MRHKTIILFSVLLLAAVPLFAPIYMNYMSLEGVTGESNDPAHKGWIDIYSFSFGAQTTVGSATGGAGAGKVAVHDITVTKALDKASPTLVQAAMKNTHFKNATLDLNGQRYLLADVVISSVQKQTTGDGSVREVIKLTFARDVTHESPANSAYIDKTVKIDFLKNTANATIGGAGGAPAAVLLRSLHVSGPVQASAGQGRSAGENSAIIVVCDVDKNGALAGLQRSFMTKQRLPALTFSALSGNSAANQKVYLTFRFENTLITGYSLASSGGGASPSECVQINLNFTRFDGPLGGYTCCIK